jgi:hypothetical protein
VDDGERAELDAFAKGVHDFIDACGAERSRGRALDERDALLLRRIGGESLLASMYCYAYHFATTERGKDERPRAAQGHVVQAFSLAGIKDPFSVAGASRIEDFIEKGRDPRKAYDAALMEECREIAPDERGPLAAASGLCPARPREPTAARRQAAGREAEFKSEDLSELSLSFAAGPPEAAAPVEGASDGDVGGILIEPREDPLFHALPSGCSMEQLAFAVCMDGWARENLLDPEKARRARPDLSRAVAAMEENADIFLGHLARLEAGGFPLDKRRLPEDDHLAKEVRGHLTLESRKYAAYRHILIEGETGTGKSIIARMLCEVFRRRLIEKRDYLAELIETTEVNCGSFPAALATAIIFGSRKGAYTDAPDSMGLIMRSFLRASPLFFDELTELPLSSQEWSIFNQYLTDGTVCRLGEQARPMFAPLPVVAATNRDTEECIREGTFRRDLKKRFALVLRVAPLRDDRSFLVGSIRSLMRSPDINPLASCRTCAEPRAGITGPYRHAVESVTATAFERLAGYEYPFNLRDLRLTLASSCGKAVSRHRRSGKAGPIALEEGDVGYVVDAVFEPTDAAFALYFREGEGGGPELLALYNEDWEHYFFLGGRCDNVQGARVPAQALRKRLADRLRRGADSGADLHPLVFAEGEARREYLEVREYSRHYLRYKDYRFFFFLFEPEEGREAFESGLAQSVRDRLLAWIGPKDLRAGRLEGRALPFDRISPRLRELLERMSGSLVAAGEGGEGAEDFKRKLKAFLS